MKQFCVCLMPYSCLAPSAFKFGVLRLCTHGMLGSASQQACRMTFHGCIVQQDAAEHQFLPTNSSLQSMSISFLSSANAAFLFTVQAASCLLTFSGSMWDAFVATFSGACASPQGHRRYVSSHCRPQWNRIPVDNLLLGTWYNLRRKSVSFHSYPLSDRLCCSI